VLAAARLVELARPTTSVLAYVDDGGRLVGWFLPEHNVGARYAP